MRLEKTKGEFRMAKAIFHAENSARKYGGKAEDYLIIHSFLDSSKVVFGDVRHRALTHNSWFIGNVIELIFGITRTNSDNRRYSVKDIAEQHVLEDFGGQFIPTAQDFLAEMKMRDWMDNARNGEVPPSRKKVKSASAKKGTKRASEKLRSKVYQRPFGKGLRD